MKKTEKKHAFDQEKSKIKKRKQAFDQKKKKENTLTIRKKSKKPRSRPC